IEKFKPLMTRIEPTAVEAMVAASREHLEATPTAASTGGPLADEPIAETVQFEDFAKHTASPLLQRYRDRLCAFNDDIQGTAAVAAGTLFSALQRKGEALRAQTILFVGAGSAACGIAEQLVRAMRAQGLADNDARARVFMAGRRGLLHDRMDGLLPFQQRFVQPLERVAGWAGESDTVISISDVIEHARPTVLIGVSGQPGLFDQEMITRMLDYCEQPVIMPLSNPTSRAEATPEDLLRWTAGRALVATGSPFDPVELDGVCYPVSQSNNSYIFPGLGLGVLAAGARRISDDMLMAAAVALGNYPRQSVCDIEPLLPPLGEIRQVSRHIAHAVARQAQREALAPEMTDAVLEKRIEAVFWEPNYPEPGIPS
ncbi:MAG: oxaloacetate-decarboxylating malate dehydrogenase, partial [Thiohalobacterales bacterium]|nr:oxaloacetate-decarboxylating malate dehydrogenase [Thiohalobacterales bacterium]